MKGTSNFYKVVSLVFVLTITSGRAFAGGGSWATKGPIAVQTVYASSAVSGNQLFVIGGDGNSGPTNVNQAYDPTTDSWSVKRPDPTVRALGGAATVNGKIYVIGGCINSDCGSLTNLNEMYDPVTDSWTPKAPMPTARQSPAIGVINGKIYVAGGGNPYISIATLEVYDPATDTWTSATSMPNPASSPFSAVINNILYVAGGSITAGAISVLQAYNPLTDSWTVLSSMPTARYEGVAASLNGILYAIGGVSTGTPYLSVNESYDPLTNSWTTQAPIPDGVYGGSAGALGGVIYVAGGDDSTAAMRPNVAAFTPPISFSSFSAKLDLQPSTGSFDLNSSFTLGTGGSIDPLTQDLALQIGSYTVTITAGSFTENKKGAYVFKGTINGVALDVQLKPVGGSSYTFQASGTGANLNGITNPVPMTLTIGNNTGSTAVTADFS